MTAYYNEIDPFAAAWLRELIRAGLIAYGDVDERSIEDVRPSELAEYTQCHFFAGIGGWSAALQLAGWPDDRPVWTGSCPCQPFSAAGKGTGFADERHLWPAFHWLIEQCRPVRVFGEQVAGKNGLAWLDLVSTDLESLGYACGAVVAPACGFGAPHKRERLYWVADADQSRCIGLEVHLQPGQSRRAVPEVARSGGIGSLADSNGWDASAEWQQSGREQRQQQAYRVAGSLGNAGNEGLEIERRFPGVSCGASGAGAREAAERTSPHASAWSDCEWIWCRDGKYRPTQSGVFPLAHGVQSCVVRCGHIEAAAIQEILDAQLDPDPRQALRVLWHQLRAALHQRSTGGPDSFFAPEVLFPFLLSLRAACDAFAYGRGGPQTNKAIHWRALRFLRMERRLVRASCGRQPAQQFALEPSDAVRLLSLNLARHAEAYRASCYEAYASTDRVGRLRGYGNAIVVPQAVDFIMAAEAHV